VWYLDIHVLEVVLAGVTDCEGIARSHWTECIV
jgi:hypothetical protein